MAGSVNKVILVGHLGADPETRTFQNGDKVVNFRIATSESWRDKNSGDRKEKTEWHSIAIFNENLAKVADQYLRKGMKVYVEGQLQTREWEKDGVKRYTTEVVLQKFRGELQMLDSRNGDGDGDRGGGGRQDSRRDDRRDDRRDNRRDDRRDDNRGQGGGGGYRDLDDEIPFAPEWR